MIKTSNSIHNCVALAFAVFLCVSASIARSAQSFAGSWAMKMPGNAAGWLLITENDNGLEGELWTVGAPRGLKNLELTNSEMRFTRHLRVGAPEYVGGPNTGERVDVLHTATVEGDVIHIKMTIPESDGDEDVVSFSGKRMPPLPPQPDLEQVRFGEPIELFNGKDISGWRLTNPNQINGWKAVDGVLVNDTPKLDFQPWSRYGNLRTDGLFMDFNLSIEFKVPPGGNSGIYLRGVYEAQVLDRDSRMQGIQGVGAIFGRIAPSEQAGKPGGEWQHYDITLVDRHVTVILNGVKVIDNQPLPGCTNGAFQADETISGPLYLQGDHTAVSYRNIVLRPVVTN